MEGEVASGMIQGGWGYVWAAYGITWTVLLAFTFFTLSHRMRPGDPGNAPSRPR